MHLLFVVQRYGNEVAGGAELACRHFATRLAERGHTLDVLTSRALSYVDWSDHFPGGTTEVDGVAVHRLSVAAPRDERVFSGLNGRVVWTDHEAPLELQRAWMRSQGPLLPELDPWLRSRAAGYDAVAFFGYLYFTTAVGLPAAAATGVPTVLHPLAHDEAPVRLPLFDLLWRHASTTVYLSEEERDFALRRFRGRGDGPVVGIGIDLGGDTGDVEELRARWGLGDRDYLLYVGRVDPEKGADELFDFFVAYKERNPGPLLLVMVGDEAKEMPPHPDVVMTGYVDDATKRAAMAGAVALVQPSYFESFSLVLAEAWSLGCAALVQEECAVLAGHARRSGGAIPYRGFAAFEAAVDLLTTSPGIRTSLGEAGRRHVAEAFSWEPVLDRYEDVLAGLRRRPAGIAS